MFLDIGANFECIVSILLFLEVLILLFQHEHEAGHNSVFVSHIHMSISTVNKVDFFKSISRLNNSVGEVTLKTFFDHNDRSGFEREP